MIRASTTTTAASSSSRGHNVFYKDALTHPRAVTRRQLAPTAKADVCTTALLRLVERPQKMSHREPKYPGITSAEALLSVTSHLCSMGHPVRLCTGKIVKYSIVVFSLIFDSCRAGGVAGLATAIVVFLNVPQCPLPYNVTARYIFAESAYFQVSLNVIILYCIILCVSYNYYYSGCVFVW